VPSEFLREIRAVCEAGAGEVTVWADAPEPDATNPVLAEAASHPWPYDPLGARRNEVVAGARLVAEAAEALAEATEALAGAGEVAGSPAEAPGPAVSRPVVSTPVVSTPAPAPAAGAPGVEAGVPDSPAEAALLDAWERDVELLLTERRRRARVTDVPVLVPGELSVSRLVALRRDPEELASRIRRPLPYKPAPLARRGTAFHRWLEQRFQAEVLLDIDALPGSADEDAAPDDALGTLQAAFEASEWGTRSPYAVEVPFQTLIDGVVVRGRMDAVFRYAGPDGERWDVVDWKTGRRPSGADAEAASVQLAAYRLAWAELRGIPLESVGAAFHYVRSGHTVRPVDLLDAEGLVGLLRAVPRAQGE
jgi:DNA helicase-2/ATP-dependent DNA helicase PcrA